MKRQRDDSIHGTNSHHKKALDERALKLTKLVNCRILKGFLPQSLHVVFNQTNLYHDGLFTTSTLSETQSQIAHGLSDTLNFDGLVVGEGMVL